MAASKQFLLNYDSNILLPYTTLDCILSNENSDPDSAKATGIYAITDSLLKNIREFLSYHGEQAVTGLEIKASQIDSSVANILGLIRVTSDDSGEVGTAEQFVKIYGLNLDNKLSSGYYLAKDGACHPIATQTSDVHDAYDVSIFIRPYEANDGTEDPIQSKIDINIRYDTQYIDVQEKQFYNKLAQKSKHSEDSSTAEGALKIYASYAAPDPTDANSTVTNIVVKEIGQNKPVQLVAGEFAVITPKGKNEGNEIQPVYIDGNNEIKPVTESVGAVAQPVYVDGGVIKAITTSLGSTYKPVYLDGGTIKEFTQDLGNNTRPVYISGGEFKEIKKTIGAINNPIYVDGNGNMTACSSTVGSTSRPIYINNGTFTPIDPCVGNINQPVYVNEAGNIVPCSSTVGGSARPIYINNGVFTPISAGVGSNTQHIYVNESGNLTYSTANVANGGKTLLTLTGGVFTASTANEGTDNAKPVYLSGGTLKAFSNNVAYTTESTRSVGSASVPVYVSGGEIKACTFTCGASDSASLVYASGGQIIKQEGASKGGAKQPIYLQAGDIKTITETVGSGTAPIYLNGGVFTACSLTPESIGGHTATDQYLRIDPSTNKPCWGEGNKTTYGTYNTPSTNVKYYILGVNKSDKNPEGNFGELQAAYGEKSIYFYNMELFQTSDERFKTFTDDIDINFDNLATIKKGIYHWKDDPNKISDIGVTAQSLEALYPEIVDENNGTKTVAYNRLGVIALAAIDKLHLRVKELENEIKELKAELKKK
jgi:hypothetical protein